MSNENLRTAARRVLQAYRGRLYEEMVRLDPSGDGVVTNEAALDFLKQKNISEVEPSELQLLLASCDRGNHGVVVAEYFEKKMNDLAQDTERERLMRRFSKDASSYHTSLINVLSIKDTYKTGKLDLQSFKKALAATNITVSEADAKSLFEEGQPPGSKDGLNIKFFCDKVNQVLRQKQIMWDFRPSKTSAKAKVQTRSDMEAAP